MTRFWVRSPAGAKIIVKKLFLISVMPFLTITSNLDEEVNCTEPSRTISGLHYKRVTILIDAPSVISK
jgi:hypothetical protein